MHQTVKLKHAYIILKLIEVLVVHCAMARVARFCGKAGPNSGSKPRLGCINHVLSVPNSRLSVSIQDRMVSVTGVVDFTA